MFSMGGNQRARIIKHALQFPESRIIGIFQPPSRGSAAYASPSIAGNGQDLDVVRLRPHIPKAHQLSEAGIGDAHQSKIFESGISIMSPGPEYLNA